MLVSFNKMNCKVSSKLQNEIEENTVLRYLSHLNHFLNIKK